MKREIVIEQGCKASCPGMGELARRTSPAEITEGRPAPVFHKISGGRLVW